MEEKGGGVRGEEGNERMKGRGRTSSLFAGLRCSNSNALSHIRMSSFNFDNLREVVSPRRGLNRHSELDMVLRRLFGSFQGSSCSCNALSTTFQQRNMLCATFFLRCIGWEVKQALKNGFKEERGKRVFRGEYEKKRIFEVEWRV